MDANRMEEWYVVLSGKRAEMERAWAAWLAEHDVSQLDPHELLEDTGWLTGGGDWRRYRIRRDALHKVIPPIEPDTGDA